MASTRMGDHRGFCLLKVGFTARLRLDDLGVVKVGIWLKAKRIKGNIPIARRDLS